MSDHAQSLDAEEPHPDDRPLGPILGKLAAEILVYGVFAILALGALSVTLG
ncbi:MAG: hypothetical protein JWP35_280 [Caulobacter sp.]|nr:hypothetical protein [Caulobacter sp.]